MKGTPKANVLGVSIDATDMEGAIRHLVSVIRSEEKGYVCLAGVHGVMEAYRNWNLIRTYEAATLVAPDGMPTVWVGHLQGHSEMRQVTGPDLMLEVMQRAEFSGCTHFLYGGKEGIADELRAQLTVRFPSLKIVGTCTPSFGPLSLSEERDLIGGINHLRPDIIWVGISTPRQELFMERMLPQLDTRLMFGVGAAFDFHTGRISDCGPWIKRCGMQWLHRLLQDPRRLWKRYLYNNPAFLWAIALQLLGLRRYDVTMSQQQSPTLPRPTKVAVLPNSKS